MQENISTFEQVEQEHGDVWVSIENMRAGLDVIWFEVQEVKATLEALMEAHKLMLQALNVFCDRLSSLPSKVLDRTSEGEYTVSATQEQAREVKIEGQKAEGLRPDSANKRRVREIYRL